MKEKIIIISLKEIIINRYLVTMYFLLLLVDFFDTFIKSGNGSTSKSVNSYGSELALIFGRVFSNKLVGRLFRFDKFLFFLPLSFFNFLDNSCGRKMAKFVFDDSSLSLVFFFDFRFFLAFSEPDSLVVARFDSFDSIFVWVWFCDDNLDLKIKKK